MGNEPYAILLDFTRCIGCGACERECARVNGLPDDPPEDKLDHRNFTVVLKHDSGQYYRRMCMHCEDPACVSVCPVAALEKTDAGPVVYHPDKCIGCRYCMVACPFQIPKYEWHKSIPVVRKCIMCNSRIENGEEPACAWVCPVDACRFGPREKLLAIAKRRVSQMPDRYVDYIYGENEVGGTSILMLSGVPFEDLGFKMDVGEQALPRLTWTVMSKIPNVVITGGIMLGGISWIINRRMDLQKEHMDEVDTLKQDKENWELEREALNKKIRDLEGGRHG